MTITLVTGADGLIGSALQRIGISEFVFLSRKDGDLRSSEIIDGIFRKFNPERVINLAARVGGIKNNMEYPADFFSDNMLININIYNCCVKYKVDRLVSFMSTCVFPDKVDYPLTPDQLHLGEPHSSNFGYAYAKRMIDVLSRTYRAQYGLMSSILIPTNVYGPNDNFHLENGHVIPSLIHRMYLAKKNREDLFVWGSGKAKREFVFSADVARLIIEALENYLGEQPLILTPEREVSIEEAVLVIKKYLGYDGNIIFDSSKPDGQLQKPSDGVPLNRLIKKFDWTSLDDGIMETVDWFYKNFDTARGANRG